VFAALLIAATLVNGPEPTPVPASHYKIEQVAPGAFAAIAVPGDRASVGNAGFVVGSEAVLAIDSSATEEGARELLAEIRKLTPLRVEWVVDTHYHLDHVGGNAVYRGAGAVVVAHANVRKWARTENLKWRKEITAADRALLDALALPEITTEDRITVSLGDRDAVISARPGHTNGDVVVRVGDVVFAGDLLWKTTVPNMIDAHTEAWVETLDGFLRDAPAAVFVPGHGPVGRALDVRFFRDYVAAVRSTVQREMDAGRTGTALADAVVQTLKPKYGAWTWFSQFASSNAAQTEQELRGTKKYAP
jgi:glyoxylase-like metal-dependent hydrolase (beta-lactamase superfamily II)